MIFRILFAIAAGVSTCSGQAYTSASVFAHNDYVQAHPFRTAYNLKVGFIEADVFLRNDELLVAHQENEVKEDKTLEKLYLFPLSAEIKKNGGSVYNNPEQTLTLMIDLKTEGNPTLHRLVEKLNQFPELVHCRNLEIMVSGNVPDLEGWSAYPSWIHFDGRPGIAYSAGQLNRISMISTNFQDHVRWDGGSAIPPSGREIITAFIDHAHAEGKKFRFWATPDFPDAWKELIRLKMDVIVTDDVQGLVDFLQQQK